MEYTKWAATVCFAMFVVSVGYSCDGVGQYRYANAQLIRKMQKETGDVGDGRRHAFTRSLLNMFEKTNPRSVEKT